MLRWLQQLLSYNRLRVRWWHKSWYQLFGVRQQLHNLHWRWSLHLQLHGVPVEHRLQSVSVRNLPARPACVLHFDVLAVRVEGSG
jgi:hypothetical protein